MIEKLTPEQEAKLPEYRDKWLGYGLSTEPLDYEKAKEAASLAYRCVDLEPPKQFYRFRSPMEAIIGTLVIQAVSEVDDRS